MIRRALALFLPIALVAPIAAHAETPASEIVQGMIKAAGGAASFNELGVLQIGLREEETKQDGETSTSQSTAFLDTTNLGNLRMELSKNLLLACHNGTGWAMHRGKMDKRPLAPRMATGTIHQKLFPLLLPFSLDMTGVRLGDVTEEDFEGDPAWRIEVSFDDDFFASPVMVTTWDLLVRRTDHQLLIAEFLPKPEFRNQQLEGVRYRPLTHTDVEGVRLFEQLLVEGLDLNRIENGHVRVVKMKPSVRGPYEPTLFLNPEDLEDLERIPGFEDAPE
jgi:hypothetical protein